MTDDFEVLVENVQPVSRPFDSSKGIFHARNMRFLEMEEVVLGAIDEFVSKTPQLNLMAEEAKGELAKAIVRAFIKSQTLELRIDTTTKYV